ncbi:MAG: NAD(P)H-hydrate dehydratase [Verrucomicrobia bacterium]|nr:NAD(P)H-hydrate dehydratase [Verrucomicrobiota bacterium]
MPVPIITVAQMREWERATWASGQTEQAVIARVGEIAARYALRLTRVGDTVLILAGKGHNGDDARLAQPHLNGRRVELINVAEPKAALAPVTAALEHRPALVIDGLFGIGLNRPLDADWCRLIQHVNDAALPVLSVDNPSGLNVESGAVAGAAIRATVTLTLGAPKHGLFAPGAVSFVGRLKVAPDIGLVKLEAGGRRPEGGHDPTKEDFGVKSPSFAIPHSSVSAWWTLPEDFTCFPPPRPAGGHKGTFGHLAVLAGSRGFHGAAVLAARGAQRAQPGLITLLPQEDVYAPVASQLQAVMVRPFETAQSFENFTAVLAGPGLAAPDLPVSLRNVLTRLWTDFEQPVIVDASALDWLPPGEPVPRQAIRVITPHPGEAARLLRCGVAEVQADREQAARELSARFGGCMVVLKGHQTLVGRAGGDLVVNSSGNPDLAQGGSGDVLAGYLAGWLAQPAVVATAADTAVRYAVWQHGAAADELSQERRNWVVEDLVERIGDAEMKR